MNFINCTVMEKEGISFLQAEGFERRSGDISGILKKGKHRREIILGIRPEHIEVGLEKRVDYSEATCDFTEPMGNRQILHLRIRQQMLKAKTLGAMWVSKADHVWVRFPAEEIRLFDADSYELRT
jgi:ABC-type sugar transport system ATPase subunit